MKLSKTTSVDFNEHELGSDLTVGEVYLVVPVKQKTAEGKNVRTFTTVLQENESWVGKHYYSFVDPTVQLKVKFLSYHNDNNKILRVRILTDPELSVRRFNKHKQQMNDVQYKLKHLPEFENLDQYTPEEFFDKFGRVKLKDDHGLVGFIWDDGNLIPKTTTKISSGDVATDVERVRSTSPSFDKLTKLDQAIQIYKTFKTLPRKDVVHKIQQILGMSQKGASSYYTKAMHAVEDD